MLTRFDLWSLADVRDNATAIIEVLRAGTMPCDEPWNPNDVGLFGRWIAAGMAE